MGYIRQFENFDPNCGVVPSYPFDLLPAIAIRARKLVSRSPEQMIQIANTADWIIEEYFRNAKEKYIHDLLEYGGWELGDLPQEERTESAIRNFIKSGFPGVADDPRSLFDNVDNTSMVTALKADISNYAFDDDIDETDGKEYQYFAVLALWLIADCLKWIQFEPPYLSLAGTAAIEAMDAVCYAEHLQDADKFVGAIQAQVSRIEDESALKVEKEVEEKLTLRISLNARKASHKRHGKSAYLRDVASKLFLSEKWPSVRQASKKIYPQLVEHGRKIGFAFSPERGEQTVYGWLLKVTK